jgi:predicted RNA-binding protein YlxR (DUF448 family)
MRASRSALLRVVAQNDTLIFDDRAVMPGRGAWVHPTRECLEGALRRRAFARALRVSQTIGFTEVEVTQTIEQHLPKNKG